MFRCNARLDTAALTVVLDSRTQAQGPGRVTRSKSRATVGQDGTANVVLRADGRYNQPVRPGPRPALDKEREADTALHRMRDSKHKGILRHNRGGKISINIHIV